MNSELTYWQEYYIIESGLENWRNKLCKKK